MKGSNTDHVKGVLANSNWECLTTCWHIEILCVGEIFFIILCKWGPVWRHLSWWYPWVRQTGAGSGDWKTICSHQTVGYKGEEPYIEDFRTGEALFLIYRGRAPYIYMFYITGNLFGILTCFCSVSGTGMYTYFCWAQRLLYPDPKVCTNFILDRTSRLLSCGLKLAKAVKLSAIFPFNAKTQGDIWMYFSG